jgi:zinc protease
MIVFKEFTLENGLRVIVHEDPTVQIAVLNILYDVGSRDVQWVNKYSQLR